MEIESVKQKNITVGGVPISVNVMPNGEYRWSMRQASMAVGFNEGWLKETLQAEGNALTQLKGYGFKGEIIELKEQDFIESYISTEDFMAMIMYAAVVAYRRQAIALLAEALFETLERRVDRVFGVKRDEDEYIQKVAINLPQAEQSENSWIRFAGVFKDDPDFAEIAEAIRAERQTEDDTEVDPTLYSVKSSI